MAREMARLGWAVEVYASPPDDDVGLDLRTNVSWLPFETYDPRSPPEVFVAWRYHISAALALPPSVSPRPTELPSSDLQPFPKAFVWLQDVPSFATYRPWFTQSLAGIFTLSVFHATQLPPHTRTLATTTPNGLDARFFADGPNAPRSFVYGSAPNRGLETVLKQWGRISLQLPGARLDVFYGFSRAFEKHGRQHLPNFESWRLEMLELLKQDGVTYRGMVPHEALAAAYAQAGFVLYPTTYPETGCVTLMKAMAMGAVPVTSRFRGSTLPELTEGWDLGPARPLQSESDGDPLGAWAVAWAQAVVEASLRDERGELVEHRARMKQAARERFLWAHVAQTWHKAFTD
jgi:glycosyltransferase involved in cell wall biosynthesis